MFKLRLLEISVNGDSYSDINVRDADKIESLDGTIGDLQSILSQASSMSTSYDATMLQAKQGKDANESLGDMEENGLDASTITLKNGDSDELTITGAGLVAKKMTDVGAYADQQLRIAGNGIYMTNDNWATITEAIGEIKDENGRLIGYGIVADNIIGKFILGENITISNEDSSVVITGDSIKLGTVAEEGAVNPTGITLNKNGSVEFRSFEEDAGTYRENVLTFDLQNGLVITGHAYTPSGQHNPVWYDYTLQLSPKIDSNGTGNVIEFTGNGNQAGSHHWYIDTDGQMTPG